MSGFVRREGKRETAVRGRLKFAGDAGELSEGQREGGGFECWRGRERADGWGSNEEGNGRRWVYIYIV